MPVMRGSIYAAIRCLALVIALGVAILWPAAAAAQTPVVKLVLGGSGATPWSIANMHPGDAGSTTVTLRNTGSGNGAVTIWISDIVSSDGANPESETGDTADPGELGTYLLLGISCSRLETNVCLPARIDSLPHGPSSANYTRLNRLNAGETLVLDWQWRLPAEVENDVQGDTLSFSINYYLQETPGSGGTGVGGGGGGGGWGGFPTPPPATPTAATTSTPPTGCRCPHAADSDSPDHISGRRHRDTLTSQNTGTGDRDQGSCR